MSSGPEYENKAISLLEFALNKKGVNSKYYYIGKKGEEFSQNDRICLLKENSGWFVLYIERGVIGNISMHSNIRDAILDFFWRLNRVDTPWDYRSEWEEKTGQTF